MRTTSPEAVGMSSDRLCHIQSKMQEYVDNNNAPGFITLIARKGQVIHYETCGLRDVAKQLPMEKDTIFRIYYDQTDNKCCADDALRAGKISAI